MGARPSKFVESEMDIALEEVKAKKAAVKKSKVNKSELIENGLDDLQKLLVELSASGLTTMTMERVVQIRGLGENLRTFQLRRLSASILRLSNLLSQSLQSRDSFSFEDYNEALVDFAVTAKAVRQIQSGTLTDPKYQEELIGKTWSKNSLTSIGPKEMLQISYQERITADNYKIYERHLIDLGSGEIFAEKEIVPEFLAKRQHPPFVKNCVRLKVDDVLCYPGFKPNRVKLQGVQQDAVTTADIDKALSFASSDFPKAIESYLEYRKDFFAPTSSLSFVQVNRLLFDMSRLQISDGQGVVIGVDCQDVSDFLDSIEGEQINAALGHLDISNGAYVFQIISLLSRDRAIAL